MFIESHGQLHLSTGEPRHCVYVSRLGITHYRRGVEAQLLNVKGVNGMSWLTERLGGGF